MSCVRRIRNALLELPSEQHHQESQQAGDDRQIENVAYVHMQRVEQKNGEQDTLPQNDDCDDGIGWFYDDPSNPTMIVFCADSCEAMRSDYGAAVDIMLGCQTVIK